MADCEDRRTLRSGDLVSKPVITIIQQTPLPKLLTVITECCREWEAPIGFAGGRCGYCGERPTFKRYVEERV
jgi:hypothetical protein